MCAGTRANKQRVMDGSPRQHWGHSLLPPAWGAACTAGAGGGRSDSAGGLAVPCAGAAEAREDTARWQERAVTQQVRFISQIFCFFFSLIHLPH